MAAPKAPSTPTPEALAQRQLEALNHCTRVGGIIAAQVNERLQKLAASLSRHQDDLMDMYHIPGTASHPGGSTGPVRQGTGNIPMMSAAIGEQAISSCLQRALGRGIDFEAIARAIEAAGGPTETHEIDTGGIISRKVIVPRNPSVPVPR